MLKMKMKYSMVMRMKNINFRIYTKKNTMTIFHYRQHSPINSKSMYSVQTCFRTLTWYIFIAITSAGYYIDYNRFLNILGISNVLIYKSRCFRESKKVNTHTVNMLFEVILDHFVKVIKKLAHKHYKECK